VIASDGCLFDGPVHPFDLAVGPRMVGHSSLNGILISIKVQ
jgi:hypothetical protein